MGNYRIFGTNIKVYKIRVLDYFNQTEKIDLNVWTDNKFEINPDNIIIYSKKDNLIKIRGKKWETTQNGLKTLTLTNGWEK